MCLHSLQQYISDAYYSVTSIGCYVCMRVFVCGCDVHAHAYVNQRCTDALHHCFV